MKEPDNRLFHLHNGQYGAAIAVHVTPRSHQDQIQGISEDGTIKIRLCAQESVEEINLALLGYLAKILGISRNKMEIVAGENCADKLIAIFDSDTSAIQKKITQSIR